MYSANGCLEFTTAYEQSTFFAWTKRRRNPESLTKDFYIFQLNVEIVVP